MVLVAVQVSVLGLYLPPVFKKTLMALALPPQTIISLPVQTAVCWYRPAGAFAVVIAVQVFVLGSYFAPVLKAPPLKLNPPQTII